MREFRKVNWENELDKRYRKIGDGDIVMRGDYMYNYDDNCWRYAIGCYYEFIINNALFENISEEEARNIVAKNGGTNFDKMNEALFVMDKDGKYVSL